MFVSALVRAVAFCACVSLAGCGGGGGDGGGNTVPFARASATPAMEVGVTTTFDASQSSDAEGNAMTYAWSVLRRPVGSVANLATPTQRTSAFLPDMAGDYTIRLVVSDGTSSSVPRDLVLVAAPVNVAPVANAGPNLRATMYAPAPVTLDGSASTDVNGQPLFYQWTVSSGAATPQTLFGEHAQFTPQWAGTYSVTLVVNDGRLNSAPSTMTLTVVDQIQGVLSISRTEDYDLCNMSVPITIESGTWEARVNEFGECRLRSAAGNVLWFRIQNNTATPVHMTQVFLNTGAGGDRYLTNQDIPALSYIDFPLPLAIGPYDLYPAFASAGFDGAIGMGHYARVAGSLNMGP